MASEEGPGAMKRIALSIRNNIDGDLHGPYTLPFAPLVNLCAGLEARRPLTEWFSVRSVNQHTSPALNRGRGSHCGGDESRGERVGADVYRDSRVFDKYASNLIDQKNTRVRALKALISSECPFWFLRQISCTWNVGIICSRKNQ